MASAPCRDNPMPPAAASGCRAMSVMLNDAHNVLSEPHLFSLRYAMIAPVSASAGLAQPMPHSKPQFASIKRRGLPASCGRFVLYEFPGRRMAASGPFVWCLAKAGASMLRLLFRNLVIAAALNAWAPLSTASAQTPPKTPQWPVTLPDSRAAQEAQPAGPAATSPDASRTTSAPAIEEAPGWSEGEIATARARCNAILSRYEAVATPMEPIKEGDCGTPYPVQVASVANVALSQPAIVNCEVIAVLGDWLKSDVQPAARQLLKARVTGIDVLSSYSCRNAYGRKKSRLSEHGRANAIDIKSFQMDRAPPVDLVADWGMTERDIKAHIAAAEAAARAAAAARAKADAEAKAQAIARQQRSPNSMVANKGQPSLLAPQSGGLNALRGMVKDIGQDDSADEARGASTLSLGQPSRLGGPKAKQEAIVEQPAVRPPSPATDASGARQSFLKTIHDLACRRFGTVLGPEANEAHRNHFHLDLAERGGRGNYCE